MTIEQILQGAEDVVHSLIRKEHSAQGHFLTGTSERSLNGVINKTVRTCSLIGYAIDYMKVVNEGVTPDRISAKAYPGLVQYFVKRGVPLDQAVVAAGRTIAKWKREGMSTQASKRFSKTGSRHHFIEAAFLYIDIDNYMNSMLDFGIEEQFLKTKSETV